MVRGMVGGCIFLKIKERDCVKKEVIKKKDDQCQMLLLGQAR